MTPADFAAVNDNAITAKQQLLDRLDALEPGASENDSFLIAQQRAETQQDLNRQKIIRQRLTAASVSVTPLDSSELNHLNVQAQLLDQAIVSNSILNADLALVTQLAAAAKGIGDILGKHVS